MSSADQLPQQLCPQCARYAVELVQEREKYATLATEVAALRHRMHELEDSLDSWHEAERDRD